MTFFNRFSRLLAFWFIAQANALTLFANAYEPSPNLPVEKFMRQYQGRVKKLGLQRVMWLPCQNGTPSPAFPEDGFYSDSDAVYMTKIVSHLVNVFLSERAIYNRFIKDNVEGSEGVTYIAANNTPPISRLVALGLITENNYSVAFHELETALSELTYLQMPFRYRQTGVKSFTYNSNISEQDCIQNTMQGFASINWNATSNFLSPEASHWGNSSASSPRQWTASISARRGEVFGDMGNDPIASARLFLKMGPAQGSSSSAMINEKSPVIADGKYHQWKTIQNGIYISPTIDGSPSNFIATFTTGPKIVVYGWRIDAATVVYAPTWEDESDVVSCSCNTCHEGSCPPGRESAKIGSIDISINLGLSNLLPLGTLKIHETNPTTRLDSPLALKAYTTATVHTNDSGSITDLRSPSVNIDVVQTGDKQWEIRFRRPSTNELYQTLAFESKYHPDGSYDKLIVSAFGSLGNRIREYTWNSDTNSGTKEWKLSLVGTQPSLPTEIGADHFDQNHDRIRIHSVFDGTGKLLSRIASKYHAFAWGEERIEEKTYGIDSNGNESGEVRSKMWEYYESNDSPGSVLSRLKSRTSDRNNWEQYFYDANGRISKIRTGFIDSPPSALDSECRILEYQYLNNDLDSDGNMELITIRSEHLLGIVVSRVFEITFPKLKVGATYTYYEIWTATNPDLSIINPSLVLLSNGSLITKRKIDSGSRKERFLQMSDGRVAMVDYAGGTTTRYLGAPNESFTSITAGTKSIVVQKTGGGLISDTTYDYSSNLILSRKTATAWDIFDRPTTISYHDSTMSKQSFDCCGLEAETDKEGIQTTYVHDSLGRVIQQVQAGIAFQYTLDALGRITKTERMAGSTTTLLETTEYDSFGNAVLRRDALSRGTAYGEVVDASGHTVKTTTYPDGGTRIETYARDGSLLSVSGTATAPLKYEYGVDAEGVFTKEIRVGSAGEETEWTKSYRDLAARPYKTVYADGSFSQSFYNSKGQLAKVVDPDGVTTLYAYNNLGEQETVALDLNRNGLIDFDGTDRVTKTTSLVTTARGTTVRRQTTTVWTTNGNGTATQDVSIVESSVDGRKTWSTVHGLTTTTEIAYPGNGVRVETTITPDGVQSIRQYSNDRLATHTVLHPSIGPLSSLTYTYDPHGRLQSTTDLRNGATTYTYYDDDQIRTITTPDPDLTRSGSGYDPQVTHYSYDAAGRLAQTTLPDATTVTQEYYPTGQLKKTSGSRTYPQAFTYDAQGRLKTLTTWQDYSGNLGQAVTTWNYHPLRGWLTSKAYVDQTGPSYSYFPSGRLKTRSWARGSTTTYAYNNAGDLASIDYSDLTPDVAFTYDRLGRLATATDAAGTLTRSYHVSGALQNEAYGPSSLLANLSVNRTFDSLDRPSVLSIANLPSSPSVTYGYDAASRLQSVTSGTSAAAYTYLPNSSLLQTTRFTQAGTTRLTSTRGYDLLNRLSSITQAPATGSSSSSSYSYNSANQRTKLTREDSTYWDYDYDVLGQLTSGKKKLSSGQVLSGHEFTYAFDDIGNRRSVTRNGSFPATAARADYTANVLNQYTQRTVPGSIDVLGAAASDATVTVNTLPTFRQGERFHGNMPVSNSAAPQNASLEIVARKNNAGPNGEDIVAQATRQAFVAQTPEGFTYDADGNLTEDGRWHYTWDAENRLLSIETIPAAVTAGAPKQKLEFTYDAMGRRIQKKVSTWNTGTSSYQLTTDLRFVYDGWNLLADLDGLNANAVLCTYVWGLDISGSLQGAGGVGGLLFTTKAGSIYATGYDGNGNILNLFNLADGSVSAEFEYDPFGTVIKATGPAANVCPFGFSTKYTDSETGLLYYGFRYYSPSTGRWPSRDPIEERGGVNLYGMIDNDPVNGIDRLGLSGATVTVTPVQPGPTPGIPGTPDGPPIEWPGAAGTGVGAATRLAGGAALFLLTPTTMGDSTIEGFERRRQEREEQISKAREKRENCGCCEMVTGVRLVNVAPWSNGYSHGHQFDVQIDVTNKKGEGGQAHLEWSERTNKPTSAFNGTPKNTWYDQVNQPRIPSGIFDPWYMRSIPCPGSQTVTLHDTAGAPYHEMPRYLEFKITVTSGCVDGPSFTLRAVQVLNYEDGFFGPNNRFNFRMK